MPRNLNLPTNNMDHKLTSATSIEITEALTDAKSMVAHLTQLDNITRNSITKVRLHCSEAFHNPNVYLAVEYHLSIISAYQKTVQTLLPHVKRYDHPAPQTVIGHNAMCRAIDLKLYRIGRESNSLSHLHDITKYNSITAYGIWLQHTYSRLIFCVDGYPYGNSNEQTRRHLLSLLEELKHFIAMASAVSNNTPIETPQLGYYANMNTNPARREWKTVVRTVNPAQHALAKASG